jgi:hypothetical protein
MNIPRYQSPLDVATESSMTHVDTIGLAAWGPCSHAVRLARRIYKRDVGTPILRHPDECSQDVSRLMSMGLRAGCRRD